MAAIDTLAQGNQQREEGNLLDSLQTLDKALIEFNEEKDAAGISETLSSRALTLRHKYQQSGEKSYLIIARAEMISSVEIAKSSGDKTATAIPLFNLAKVHEELGENEESVNRFKEALNAITTNPPASHNRPAVIADFKIHLATAEWKNGDQSAKERLEQALSDLQQSDEDSFNKNVWMSGAYMNLAHLSRQDRSAAEDYLNKAKEIIDSDQRLILRKAQWEKLAQSFE